MAGPILSPADAQSGIPVVTYLALATVETDAISVEAFRRGLRKAGRIEGRNIRFEFRNANGDPAEAAKIVEEAERRQVAVLIAPGPVAIRLAARRSIPTVAVGLPSVAGDHGLFRSLARPGGNVTGFSYFGEDLARKRVELIRQIQPGLTSLGILHNGTDPTFADWGMQSVMSAEQQGLRARRLPLASRDPDHIRATVEAFRREGGEGVVVIRDFMTVPAREAIVASCTSAGLSVYAEEATFVEAGAIMSYGADIPDLFERAALYVDRILRGEKPGDLPIQLASSLHLAVSTRAATALGITLPGSILASADLLVD